MNITAKFAGKCKKCGGYFAAGSLIDWDKGTGARHTSCPSSPTVAPVRTPGQASEKQITALRRLLNRVSHISQFDSFGGSGDQIAAEMQDQIRQWGGMDKLTSKQASGLIDQLIGLANDEM